MRIRSRVAGLALATGLTLGVAGPAPTASAADTLTVMSLNTWLGGTKVTDGVNKIAAEITKAGADVVSLQEYSADSTQKIAAKLGWYATDTGTDVDIVSRLPFEGEDWTAGGGGTVAVKIKGVWIYSVHLDYTKYGPYNACFDNDSYATIYADEANRKKQAQEILNWAGSSPAIIAGDFNTPSHLDWTADTQAVHCNSVVQWPATKIFADAGYSDAYRKVNPDEATVPGNTWSPVVKTNQGRPEPQDRIDLILYRGGPTLNVTSARTWGGGSNWPSDHLAVVAKFNL
ncbi:endonuclease/exonuclease/phosphatase family protein [Streptomyces pathocidini]|uniref:Endonuclease/exonuclease/phosphatase family protein n=1 Tax=Streptomyces pathocidini TaxID=1650571 RepID=A0ABW7URR8_9ACTN|nr:endonuclease/exonuclease/phosphatase family protein [Streptomyces pathocidini]